LSVRRCNSRRKGRQTDLLNLKPPRHSYSTLFCHTGTAPQGQLTVGHALLAKPSRNSRFLRKGTL